MAGRYELQHRVPGQDLRRMRFATHVELLTKLSPARGQRQANEYAEILREHPFR